MDCRETRILTDIEAECIFSGIFYIDKSLGVEYKTKILDALSGSISSITLGFCKMTFGSHYVHCVNYREHFIVTK